MEEKKYLIMSAETEEKGLYDYQSRFISYLNKLDDIEDKDLIKFLWHHRLKGIGLKRLINIIQCYNKLLKDDFKHLSKINEKDMEIIYLKIINSKLSNATQITYLRIIKQILKYYKLHKKIDLEQFKIKEKKKPILSNELLSEDEKHYIIENIRTLEKKVFFTILFDTGLRVGEVYSINRDSFQKIEKGYIITINKSKTEIRTVLTYSHNHYIEKLLKKGWFSWSFGYETTYKEIKKFEKKLNKRLYHHLARHTRATELAQKLTEQELKSYFGWSPNSQQLNNYIHLNNKKIIEKLQNMI